MNVILSSLRKFTGSFVDDVAVHSHQWKEHLDLLDQFLAVVKKHGLTLSLKKCRFAQSQVKFCGVIIGSGKRFTDSEKLQVVQEMKPPITKTEVKRILGFFSYFREHIKDFANVAQPLTDLTSKKYSGKFPWGESQQQSFQQLKHLLCKAMVEPLYIVDFTKPFNLFIDASLHTVSAVLSQTGDDGTELPVAFLSTKLSQAQMAWSTIDTYKHKATDYNNKACKYEL